MLKRWGGWPISQPSPRGQIPLYLFGFDSCGAWSLDLASGLAIANSNTKSCESLAPGVNILDFVLSDLTGNRNEMMV